MIPWQDGPRGLPLGKPRGLWVLLVLVPIVFATSKGVLVFWVIIVISRHGFLSGLLVLFFFVF